VTTVYLSTPRSRWLRSPVTADLAWAALYAGAGVWWLARHDLPEIFTAAVYYDVIVNLLAPWILAPGLMLYGLWKARDFFRSFKAALGGLAVVAACGLLLWGTAVILHQYGGWSFVVAIPVLFSKVPWRDFFANRREQGLALLMKRSMLVPFACFAPALIASCLVLGRRTLDNSTGDWVGLFGVLYFVAQAALDWALLRGTARAASTGP